MAAQSRPHSSLPWGKSYIHPISLSSKVSYLCEVKALSVSFITKMKSVKPMGTESAAYLDQEQDGQHSQGVNSDLHDQT